MSGVRPIADPFALERALQETERKLSALQAAAREVCSVWGADQPGADGRSPWGSLIELRRVLEDQGGVAAAVVKGDGE
ncbi:hypothetical protein STAQ_28110 [Allostella sp. ATCC 35155]|nr:hypothetical protein STAQ_28110 [Stella sp. ATCC 35155]